MRLHKEIGEGKEGREGFMEEEAFDVGPER